MAQFLALVHRDLDRFTENDYTPELLEAEAERARRLYADGTYRAMWSRGDVPGAAVLLEASSLEAAAAALDSLPLAERGMLIRDALIALTPYRGFGPRG